jgi:periplasmic divalent cation tolerance protein
MHDLSIVYITAPNKKEAVKIGKELVKNKLAACVNVYDGVVSIYKWEGKQSEDTEAVLFAKTKKKLFPKIKDFVRSIHSYECPCIVSIPLAEADGPFADWIRKNTL